jgi:hypothetical protein
MREKWRHDRETCFRKNVGLINNNNKTNTKHKFNVKYERYKQDISKDTLQMQKKWKKPTFLRKHVSLSCLHFSLKEWLAKRNKATLISLCSRGRATSADIGREFRPLRLVWWAQLWKGKRKRSHFVNWPYLDYKAKLKSPCFFLQVTLFLQIIFVLW